MSLLTNLSTWARFRKLRAGYIAKAMLVTLVSTTLITNATPAYSFLLDQFDNRPEGRWAFFADTVMGGVSSGQVRFMNEDSRVYARMTGNVSTANNGGFIQIRRQLDERLPSSVRGVRLVVRGNSQRYYVHLRTRGAMLPWQFYQAKFQTGKDWSEVRLPLSAFEPSGGLLRKIPAAPSIRTLAIVAYGRDHEAEIEILEISFYQ